MFTKSETEESTGRATIKQKHKDTEHKPVMTISPSFSERITFSKGISLKETQDIHSKRLTH